MIEDSINISVFYNGANHVLEKAITDTLKPFGFEYNIKESTYIVAGRWVQLVFSKKDQKNNERK